MEMLPVLLCELLQLVWRSVTTDDYLRNYLLGVLYFLKYLIYVFSTRNILKISTFIVSKKNAFKVLRNLLKKKANNVIIIIKKYYSNFI